MPKIDYLLDACAVLAFYDKEQGWETVLGLLDRAERGEINAGIHSVNLTEVYYDRIRKTGLERADVIIRNLISSSLNIIETLPPAIIREAALFKTPGKMSLADSFLAAAAVCTGATLVTADWDELEPIAEQGKIPFLWLRPKPTKS